ncbi:MAG: type II secretion system F family protein [Acidimicrobiales bacterium]
MTVLMLLVAVGMLAGAAGVIVFATGMCWPAAGMASVKGKGLSLIRKENQAQSGEEDAGSGNAGSHGLAVKIILSALASVVAIAVTSWPVAGLLVFCAGIGIPAVLNATKSTLDGGKVEAIAGWTELLRDSLASSSGLLQAIMSTATISPKAIRLPVERMASRLGSGMPVADAIGKFGEEIDDPSGDLVVCALLLAAGAKTQRLADLLGELATSMREEVAARMRIEASRASAKSSVRTVVIFSALFFLGLLLLAHSYLAPFGSPTGQLVLLFVGGCYVLGVWLMLKMDKLPTPVRLVGQADDGALLGAVKVGERGAKP